MSREEIAHYERRAAEERKRASTARDARTAQSHIDLAEKYEAVVNAYLKAGRRVEPIR
jgi:hypothetical protein